MFKYYMSEYPKEKKINCKRCGKPITVIFNDRHDEIIGEYCSDCKKNRDKRYNKILSGLEKQYKNHRIDCEKCGGTGKINGYSCVECNGTGKIKDPHLRLDVKASNILNGIER